MNKDIEREFIIERVLGLWQEATKLYPSLEHYPPPFVDWDCKGKVAGTAAGAYRVSFNWGLYVDNRETFHAQTIPHEVAHCVVAAIFGGRAKGVQPHGKEWKRVMRQLGCEPLRCHSMDTSKVRIRSVTRYLYSCSCKVWKLTKVRHNRSLKGTQYSCPSCGVRLQQGDHVFLAAKRSA